MPQDLQQFITNNFSNYIIFSFFWCIGGFALTWFLMKKKGMSFPDKSTVNIKFEEKMASGKSHKSAITKLSSGRYCLNVIVTDKELWISAIFPFNLVAYYYDAIHRIPLSSVHKTSKSNKSVFVEFQRNDGSPGKFELQLKDPDNFLKILKQSS